MRCSGPSLPSPTPHLRNCSEVPKASHLPVMQRRFRAGPDSGPSHPPCVLWAFLSWGEGSRPGQLGLLIGPGSQGTPVGTCPAVSVSPACGGSTAHSKLSETRRTHGGSGGGSPVGKRGPVVTGGETSRGKRSFHLGVGPSIPGASWGRRTPPSGTCSLQAKFSPFRPQTCFGDPGSFTPYYGGV